MKSIEERMARIHGITGCSESAPKKQKVVKCDKLGKMMGLCGALMLVAIASISVAAAKRAITYYPGVSYDNSCANAFSSELPRGTILNGGEEIDFYVGNVKNGGINVRLYEQESEDSACLYETGYSNDFTMSAEAFCSGDNHTTLIMPEKKPYYLVVGSIGNSYLVSFSSYIYVTDLNVNITYDPNGGDGESFTDSGNGDMTVKNNTFAKSGYDFVGWNTDKTSSSAAYEPGGIIKPTDSVIRSQFSPECEKVDSSEENPLSHFAIQDNNKANLTLYAIWKKQNTVINNTSVNEEKSEIIDPNQINAKKVKLVAGKKKIKVTWKKFKKKQQKLIKGFEIRYSTDKDFKTDVKKVTVGQAKAASKKIGKLSSKKRYYVEIRTYTIKDGEKVYSLWTKPKKVKVK